MLGLAHLLLLWSDDARYDREKSHNFRHLALLAPLVVWVGLQLYASEIFHNAFIVLLSAGYAWKQRSLWPLSLLVCTLDFGPTVTTSIDSTLQLAHAWLVALLLAAERQIYTVIWQGVAVHVGPSCVNLLMFQAAAAVGWLASPERQFKKLVLNMTAMLALAIGLNFARIISLTLLAPLAPNEEAWFFIHDGLSLGCSGVLIMIVWRRLKVSSTSANPIIAPQTQSQ